MKRTTYRCKACGEVEFEDLLRYYSGQNGFDTSQMMCTTCDALGRFTKIEEEEEMVGDDPRREAVEVEEDEMITVTCIHCGTDFETDDMDCEVCDECGEHLSECYNENVVVALSIHFGVGVLDISEDGDGTYYVDGKEYLVLDEDEADEKAGDYIKDSLWAFNADFLAGETGISYTVFKALSELYEGANEAVEALIEHTCGMDSFIAEAISADGRGNFMNSYDGREDEMEVDGETYFIYRM